MSDDGFGIWGIIGGLALGAVAIAGVIFVVKITYKAVMKWVNAAKNRHPDAKTCELIKERYKSGKHGMICGVFDSNHKKLENKKWEGAELDPELEAKFGQKTKLVITI